MRGKEICRTLKNVRRAIAQANSISYEPTECTHKGPCAGTCPRCEQEMRYLEQQLSLRKRLGKAVAVVGVALSAITPSQAQAQTPVPSDNILTDKLQQDTLPVTSMLRDGEQGVVWRGQVLDEDSIPIIGVAIKRVEEGKEKPLYSVTDVNGCFAIEAPIGSKIVFAYVGYENKEMIVKSQNPNHVIFDEADQSLMGEVTVGVVERVRIDDVYYHSR